MAGSGERSASTGRRLAALAALLAAAATVVFAVLGVLRNLGVVGGSFLAVLAVFEGATLIATSRGGRRVFGVALASAGMVGLVVLVVAGDAVGAVLAVLVGGVLTTILSLLALRPEPYRPPVARTPPPSKPFFLMNPKSGGGKVRSFDLDGKAEAMGAEVVYLEGGVDAVAVLRQAVADGADLLGAAGGDGTQALVAQVAAEHDLPVLCIPAGTRNHFALDLGLDREDPSLALDALGAQGEEIRIDLGEVGGRPFVNNVSLGAYAEIVARPEYRDAKFTTVMAALPEVADPNARSGLTVEADGQPAIEDPQLVQVANNPYAAPEDPAPAGTRPRLDTGLLGIDVVAYRDPAELRALVAAAATGSTRRAAAYRHWTGPRLRVGSADGTVRAGVDGEAIDFPSPLEIAIRPGALRVRVPHDRPGPKASWQRVDRLVLTDVWNVLVGRADR
ncbi:MAG TPA: diacylglycerol kinase family protein [Actinomycetota bacterium]|nr:diacylglycerol kinase family protein [Actinomycetota bacterium]